MSTLTWLHLSDLHFRREQAYDEDIVLQALLRDVAERIVCDGLQPDFAVISGDLAKDRLFPVSGNHDVDRGAISPLAAGGRVGRGAGQHRGGTYWRGERGRCLPGRGQPLWGVGYGRQLLGMDKIPLGTYQRDPS
jgi:hypothetical protein